MPRPIKTKNNNSQITSILKAISNMRRLQILNELADGREKSVSELEKVVPDLSQSTLSQHQGRLRRSYFQNQKGKPIYILFSSKCRSAQNINNFNKVVCK